MIEISPRGGTTLASVEEVLNRLKSDAMSHGTDGGLLRENYLSWIPTAALHLRTRLRGADVAQLVYSPQYFSISQTANSDPAIYSKVTAEWAVLAEMIGELLTEVSRLKAHWGIGGTFVVLDTNKLVQTKQPFTDIDWREELALDDVVHLVVPMAVIDELDSLKRTQRRSAARQALKLIEGLVQAPGQRVALPAREPYLPVTFEVLEERLGHQRLANTDSEIVSRAAWLRDLGAKVVVATWDTGTRFRATGQQLVAVRLPPNMETTT